MSSFFQRFVYRMEYGILYHSIDVGIEIIDFCERTASYSKVHKYILRYILRFFFATDKPFDKVFDFRKLIYKDSIERLLVSFAQCCHQQSIWMNISHVQYNTYTLSLQRYLIFLILSINSRLICISKCLDSWIPIFSVRKANHVQLAVCRHNRNSPCVPFLCLLRLVQCLSRIW